MRRRARSRAPLAAALSAAAILLAVVVYLLAVQSSHIEINNDSGKWAGSSAESQSRKPHLVDSHEQRPGFEPTRSQEAHSLPSREADRTGSDEGEPEFTEEPVGPAPAPSPELEAEEPQDFLPIPIPEEPAPETEPDTGPLKGYIAQLYSVNGDILLCRKGTEKWERGSESDRIFEGDRIKTPIHGTGVLALSAGGSLVLNRSTMLLADSHMSYRLEKGEVLACSYGRTLSVSSAGSVASIRRSEACVKLKSNRSTRIVATAGVVEVRKGDESVRVPAGRGVSVDSDSGPGEIEDADVGEEIEWVTKASRDFKLWIEGESCRHMGFFVFQEKSRDISNSTSLLKAATSAKLWWGLKLPHTMNCYVWVRYARSDREPEDIELLVNCKSIDKKTIKAASAKYFWIRAFKTTLGTRNHIKLVLESEKHVKSRIDLVLVTNDPDFKPSRDIPSGGYYGK